MGLDYSMQLIVSGVLNVTQVSLRLLLRQRLIFVFHTSLRQIMPSPSDDISSWYLKAFFVVEVSSPIKLWRAQFLTELPLAHRRN